MFFNDKYFFMDYHKFRIKYTIMELPGLMLSGFARGSQALNDPALSQRAVKAAGFLKKYLFLTEPGTLLRSCYTSDNKDVEQM